MTIHKVQGLKVERAILDVTKAGPQEIYTQLTRCPKMENLIIVGHTSGAQLKACAMDPLLVEEVTRLTMECQREFAVYITRILENWRGLGAQVWAENVVREIDQKERVLKCGRD